MQASPIAWLLEAASRRPSDTAICYGNVTWTWSRLAEEVFRTAAVVANQGFEADSRIGLVLAAAPEFVAGLLGVIAAGFTAVPLSPLYTPRELAALIRLNAMAAVLADRENARDCSVALLQCRAAAPILCMGPSDFGCDVTEAISRAVPYTAGHVSANRTALVFHTAGATGRVKLISRTHGQLAAECDGVAVSLGTSPEDRLFCMLPMYSGHGMLNCLFASLRAQCSLFVYERPVGSAAAFEDVLASLSSTRATIVPTIPYQVQRMLCAAGRYDLGAIRLCFSSAAKLSAATFEAFRQRFGIAVRQQYRCTEAGAVTMNLDVEPAVSAHSVGRPLPGVSVEVLEPDCTGEGEIFVRGAAVSGGYEGLSELNRSVFFDGGFRTGDVGRIDPDGNLVVTQRRPFYVDVAGHKVDVSEVEDVLVEAPGVREALVTASASTSEGIRAVLACSKPTETAQVLAFCREHLAAYKVPSVIECREELSDDDVVVAEPCRSFV